MFLQSNKSMMLVKSGKGMDGVLSGLRVEVHDSK